MERNNGREKDTKTKGPSPIVIHSHLRCLVCKVHHTFTLPPDITKDQFTADLGTYIKGEKKIQQAFPYLTEDDRELMLTGYCTKAWDELFSEDD